MILYRINTTKSNIPVVMESITEKQEISIDRSSKYYGESRYKREDDVIIPGKNIYMYGSIDFNNKNDVDTIKRFNLINKEKGAWIHSNFDYEKGIVIPENNIVKGYFTMDCLLWFKECYCMIGKPERIIVYKDSTR